MVSHYPSQGAAIASLLAAHVGVPAEQVFVGQRRLRGDPGAARPRRGPLLMSLPTFSAYYEFADGPVVTHQLDAGDGLQRSTSTSSTRWSSATRRTPS